MPKLFGHAKHQNARSSGDVSTSRDLKGKQFAIGSHSVVVHDKIAEGGFAVVLLVRSLTHSNRYYALKRQFVNETKKLEAFKREIQIIQALSDHKNIIRYIDSCIAQVEPDVFECMLLTKFYRKTVLQEMNDRLARHQFFNENEVLRILSDMCAAVARLHHAQTPIIHRDLKVENILIDDDGQTYVLCDFGSATHRVYSLADATTQQLSAVEEEINKNTTLAYRAPEMVDLYGGREITTKADIWALGVMLYKLCYFALPFAESALSIQNGIFHIPTEPTFSTPIEALIYFMLVIEPDLRPDIYQVSSLAFQLLGKRCPVGNLNGSTVPSISELCRLRKSNVTAQQVDGDEQSFSGRSRKFNNSSYLSNGSSNDSKGISLAKRERPKPKSAVASSTAVPNNIVTVVNNNMPESHSNPDLATANKHRPGAGDLSRVSHDTSDSHMQSSVSMHHHMSAQHQARSSAVRPDQLFTDLHEPRNSVQANPFSAAHPTFATPRLPDEEQNYRVAGGGHLKAASAAIPSSASDEFNATASHHRRNMSDTTAVVLADASRLSAFRPYLAQQKLSDTGERISVGGGSVPGSTSDLVRGEAPAMSNRAVDMSDEMVVHNPNYVQATTASTTAGMGPAASHLLNQQQHQSATLPRAYSAQNSRIVNAVGAGISHGDSGTMGAAGAAYSNAAHSGSTSGTSSTVKDLSSETTSQHGSHSHVEDFAGWNPFANATSKQDIDDDAFGQGFDRLRRRGSASSTSGVKSREDLVMMIDEKDPFGAAPFKPQKKSSSKRQSTKSTTEGSKRHSNRLEVPDSSGSRSIAKSVDKRSSTATPSKGITMIALEKVQAFLGNSDTPVEEKGSFKPTRMKNDTSDASSSDGDCPAQGGTAAVPVTPTDSTSGLQTITNSFSKYGKNDSRYTKLVDDGDEEGPSAHTANGSATAKRTLISVPSNVSGEPPNASNSRHRRRHHSSVVDSDSVGSATDLQARMYQVTSTEEDSKSDSDMDDGPSGSHVKHAPSIGEPTSESEEEKAAMAGAGAVLKKEQFYGYEHFADDDTPHGEHEMSLNVKRRTAQYNSAGSRSSAGGSRSSGCSGDRPSKKHVSGGRAIFEERVWDATPAYHPDALAERLGHKPLLDDDELQDHDVHILPDGFVHDQPEHSREQLELRVIRQYTTIIENSATSSSLVDDVASPLSGDTLVFTPPSEEERAPPSDVPIPSQPPASVLAITADPFISAPMRSTTPVAVSQPSHLASSVIRIDEVARPRSSTAAMELADQQAGIQTLTTMPTSGVTAWHPPPDAAFYTNRNVSVTITSLDDRNPSISSLAGSASSTPSIPPAQKVPENVTRVVINASPNPNSTFIIPGSVKMSIPAKTSVTSTPQKTRPVGNVSGPMSKNRNDSDDSEEEAPSNSQSSTSRIKLAVTAPARMKKQKAKEKRMDKGDEGEMELMPGGFTKSHKKAKKLIASDRQSKSSVESATASIKGGDSLRTVSKSPRGIAKGYDVGFVNTSFRDEDVDANN